MAIVHPTAEQRAFLAEVVQIEATSVGEEVAGARSTDELDKAVCRARVHVRMARATEDGELDVDGPMIDALRQFRAGALACIGDDQRSLIALREGDAGCCYHDMSPEESERETLRVIDLKLDELAACDSLLAGVA